MSGDQRDASPQQCPACGSWNCSGHTACECPQLEELPAPLLERLRWLNAHFPDSVTGAACGEAASELERLRSMSQTDSEAIEALSRRCQELQETIHTLEANLRLLRFHESGGAPTVLQAHTYPDESKR